MSTTPTKEAEDGAAQVAEDCGHSDCRALLQSRDLASYDNPYGLTILRDAWQRGFNDEMRNQVRERLRQHKVTTHV